MVRFVAMSPELFGLLPLAEPDAHCMSEKPEARTAVCAAPNVALAMIDGGKVLGAAGVVQVWPGRGYAWMLAGIWMERRHFGLALRRCRQELVRLQTAGMWRVEAAVRTDVPAAARWVAHMGFAREGTMRRFGTAGEDHDLWALLPVTHDERCSLIERIAA